MMADKKPQVILDLEREFGFELEEVKHHVYFRKAKSFSKNKNGEITGLDLYLTQVTNLSPLKQLNSLTQLYLRSTQVTDLSPLKQLNNLTQLYLRNTPINDLSPLKQLNSLTTLDLSSTQVNDLSPLKQLNKLRALDARHCKIEKISIEIAEKFEFETWRDAWDRRKISLYGNPLGDFLPPEIINQGQKAVVAYLKAKEETTTTTENTRGLDTPQDAPLNEVKVLLVGGGGSGKTSIIKRLMDKNFDPKEDQTHGIRIIKHDMQCQDANISAHFWDFGGQEINHATHQFFYSKRSLYLLVLDARQDQKAEYWLKYIESFGGNSPVLIVLNKIDENPSFEVNRRFLMEKHPNIIGFHRVSCSTDVGVDGLKEAVHDALYHLEFRKLPLAPSWFAVKEALTNMEDHYISYDKYFEICKENKVIDKDAQDVLRELIHDLGLALDFKKLRRYDKQVLNPKWITNGVYRIINSPLVADKYQGVLHFEQMDKILNDFHRYDTEDDKKYKYTENTHPYVIGIMQEFELCYELGNDQYIVPDLLPVEEPEGLDYAAHPLHFVIRYEDLLPRSIMPRFMVQMHHRIPEGTDKRWRTGVVIQEPLYEASAIIRADYAEKEIHIWVKGEDRQRMLSFIRKTFEGIRKSFEKLDISEWVMIRPKQGKVDAIMVKYSTLLAHDNKKRKLYFCPELEEELEVSDLLNGIEIPESRQQLAPLRAFISYSKKDIDLKDTFKAFLKPLSYENGLALWDDHEIDVGAEWEKDIIDNLNRNELIFLLISADFIATDYIWNVEVPKAIERHEKKDAIVIPIILRPCDWEALSLAKLQAIPEKGKPVTTWKNEDSAWLNVTQQIRKVLKSERIEYLREDFWVYYD